MLCIYLKINKIIFRR